MTLLLVTYVYQKANFAPE